MMTNLVISLLIQKFIQIYTMIFNPKPGGGVNLTPFPPGKPTFKKPSLIRVKDKFKEVIFIFSKGLTFLATEIHGHIS